MNRTTQVYHSTQSVEHIAQLLDQKTELATRAVDMLLFQAGPTGQMVQTMAQMAGIQDLSISLIFPTKKPGNMRPFLDSLRSIMQAALDDRVELNEFTELLAENIKVIQQIAEEENQ